MNLYSNCSSGWYIMLSKWTSVCPIKYTKSHTLSRHTVTLPIRLSRHAVKMNVRMLHQVHLKSHTVTPYCNTAFLPSPFKSIWNPPAHLMVTLTVKMTTWMLQQVQMESHSQVIVRPYFHMAHQLNLESHYPADCHILLSPASYIRHTWSHVTLSQSHTGYSSHRQAECHVTQSHWSIKTHATRLSTPFRLQRHTVQKSVTKFWSIQTSMLSINS